eukprot:443247-Pleurochrysis_carterae.AAC.3
MARERPCDSWGSRRRTCHSNRPPRRMNGRSVRLPSALGGNPRARTFPKSPTATHGRGLPSTPETVSEQDRTLTKSRTSGCCAHVGRYGVPLVLQSTLGDSKLCEDLRVRKVDRRFSDLGWVLTLCMFAARSLARSRHVRMLEVRDWHASEVRVPRAG